MVKYGLWGNEEIKRCVGKDKDGNEVEYLPVVHGRWVKDGDWLICINCENEINVKNSLGVENRKNYCPNCGAKMDEE